MGLWVSFIISSVIELVPKYALTCDRKQMQSFNDGHKNFLDIYPAMERLAPGASTNSDAVMMVDIGGGQGHQAIGMKKKFPDLPGRYIVTDLAHGLPVSNDENAGVEFLVHDFTTEMPIKGKYNLQYRGSKEYAKPNKLVTYRCSTILSPIYFS